MDCLDLKYKCFHSSCTGVFALNLNTQLFNLIYFLTQQHSANPRNCFEGCLIEIHSLEMSESKFDIPVYLGCHTGTWWEPEGVYVASRLSLIDSLLSLGIQHEPEYWSLQRVWTILSDIQLFAFYCGVSLPPFKNK